MSLHSCNNISNEEDDNVINISNGTCEIYVKLVSNNVYILIREGGGSLTSTLKEWMEIRRNVGTLCSHA